MAIMLLLSICRWILVLRVLYFFGQFCFFKGILSPSKQLNDFEHIAEYILLLRCASEIPGFDAVLLVS